MTTQKDKEYAKSRLEIHALLANVLRSAGERLPKKHGDWYRINVFDNHWLVLDTWNGEIYHYPDGATPSDTDNMYRVVYVFYDSKGKVHNCKTLEDNMVAFWYGHVCHKNVC